MSVFSMTWCPICTSRQALKIFAPTYRLVAQIKTPSSGRFQVDLVGLEPLTSSELVKKSPSSTIKKRGKMKEIFWTNG